MALDILYDAAAIDAAAWVGKPVRDGTGKVIGAVESAFRRENGDILGLCRLSDGGFVESVLFSARDLVGRK